jgi:hypothetical protein
MAEPIQPETDLAKIAAVRRSELAQTYLSSPQVETLLGIDAAALSGLRSEKRLLGVWHQPARSWLYPDFQFNNKGPIEQMPSILAVYDRYYSHVWENTWFIVE